MNSDNFDKLASLIDSAVSLLKENQKRSEHLFPTMPLHKAYRYYCTLRFLLNAGAGHTTYILNQLAKNENDIMVCPTERVTEFNRRMAPEFGVKPEQIVYLAARPASIFTGDTVYVDAGNTFTLSPIELNAVYDKVYPARKNVTFVILG